MPLNNIVDNLLKPVEGIEPSVPGIPSPGPSQTTGWKKVYHAGRAYLADDMYVYDEPDIVDIKEGDEIQSLDEKTGELVWSRVKQLAFMGVKQTYRIVTEDGRSIRTTANHPYLVKNAKGKWLKHRSEISGAGWTAVSQLKKGDEIAVVSEEKRQDFLPSRMRGASGMTRRLL